MKHPLLEVVKIIGITVLVSLMVGCKEDTEVLRSGVDDCDALVLALIELDNDKLDGLLTPELDQIDLLDQDNNGCLHDNNLRAFADMLDQSCAEINSVQNCCGCLDTFPMSSIVEILVDSQDLQITRFIDLVTPNENGEVMQYVRVRD